MKTTLILFAAMLSILGAAVENRTWTSAEGKTLTGKLVGKGPAGAEIMLPSLKRVKIPLSKLSPDDQKYVEETNVLPPPEMLARTVSVKSNEAGTKADARGVTVDVKNTAGKKMRVDLVWIASVGSGVKAGGKESQPISEDGQLKFSIVFKAGQNYKGFAVALYGEDGTEVSRFATMKPWERFLDE